MTFDLSVRGGILWFVVVLNLATAVLLTATSLRPCPLSHDRFTWSLFLWLFVHTQTNFEAENSLKREDFLIHCVWKNPDGCSTACEILSRPATGRKSQASTTPVSSCSKSSSLSVQLYASHLLCSSVATSHFPLHSGLHWPTCCCARS